MDRLYAYAMELDVRITYTNLTHLKRNGDYCRRHHSIRLQHGMVYRKERSVLAHELAHATYGDEPTMFDHVNTKQERQADEWAAHFLINRQDYELAEDQHGLHVPSMAQELCVLEKLVHAYERSLQRIGDSVYVNPRMGAGQHHQKYEVA